MPVEILDRNGTMTAFLEGEIDHHNAPPLREAIDDAVIAAQPRRLRLDFANVAFMDSSGVGLVMGRYKTVSSYGGSIELTNLPSGIKKVMKLSGIGKIAEIK